MRKPFRRKQTNSWYFKDARGKMIRLTHGDDKAAAYVAWHKCVANGESVAAVESHDKKTRGYLAGEYLCWVRLKREESTYDWYLHYVTKFVKYIGEQRSTTDLSPLELEQWVDKAFRTRTENGRLNAKRAVMTLMNWGVKKRLMSDNPLRGAEIAATDGSKEEATYQPRRTYLTTPQWELVVTAIPSDDWLHDFLCFLRATGCRPHEARILDASKHLARTHRVFVIPRGSSKGKKKERVIPCNDTAMAIVTRWAFKYPDGPIFRNAKGRPISIDMLCGRLAPLGKKLGIGQLHAYIFRRSFITDAVRRGETADVLKTVVGHSTTHMIQTVYCEMEQCFADLVHAARRATGEVA